MAAGMDQSRWSELPEDLVHHIFSFLPTISEAARLCLLSKSWQHAWHSYLEGPSFVFIYTEESPSKLQKFYKFVEDTMSNFTTQRSIRKIHNFVLKSATLFDYVRDSIDIAIDNQVSEMTLSTNYYLRQQIPAKILNNSCLKSLNLDLPVYWGERRNDPTVSVNLPTLQSLTLSNIGVRTLERFLEGCPLLKTLRCSRFRCSSAGKSFLTDHSCSKLEFLSLEITHFNAESFDEFLPKLGFLETLILSFKENDDRISISNASVSNFELHIWESIGEVVIDTPRLSCFRYTKHNCGWMLKPRISMMQPTKNCQAHLTIPFYYINFQKDLTELVGLCGDLRTLSIFHRLKEPGDETNEGKSLASSSMSQIEGLNCQLDVPPLAPCARVLDRVLQICRPLIVTLAASGDRLKVVPGMLENREEEFECHCRGSVKCWNHQLKEVKIVEERYCYKPQASHVCFRLKW